jgi:hypothetical protein
MIVAMTAMTRRPMPVVPVRSDADGGSPAREAGPEPAHALYGHAAGLLASAGALEAAAHAPGAAAAVGPTLACLEASLDALAAVAGLLGEQAGEPTSQTAGVRTAPGLSGSEVDRRFRHLIGALERSRVACAYARVAVGPVQSCARRTFW